MFATDDNLIVRNATWAEFQHLLAVRGDRGAPRFHYLEGAIQILRPSRHHEAIKGLIGCLVEAYCLKEGVEFSTFGSWTLQDEAVERGAEPDECYVFGLDRPGDDGRPDLAIEVEWRTRGAVKRAALAGARQCGRKPTSSLDWSAATTSDVVGPYGRGGLNKLEIYRKLGVREVWIWRRGSLTPYVLHGEEYVASEASGVLPNLDLALLASFVDERPTSLAIREFRAALSG